MDALERMKANRRLWIEALRSGKYTQARDALQTRDGAMCCLGVLADIAGCSFEWRDGFDYPWVEDAEGDQHAPSKAREFVGLAHCEGHFAGQRSLAGLNDSGKSFLEIADIIESEPQGLFIESVA